MFKSDELEAIIQEEVEVLVKVENRKCTICGKPLDFFITVFPAKSSSQGKQKSQNGDRVDRVNAK